MSYPVVHNHYNQPGLNGFFGNLLKTVATAVGAMVGGVFGAAVVQFAAYGIDRYINGNENASMSMFGIKLFGPQTNGLNAAKTLKSAILQTNNQTLEKWVKDKFEPYILRLAKGLNYNNNVSTLKSNTYRIIVNEVIKSLSIAAYYFESQEKNAGLNGLIDLDDVEVNSESKSTVIYSFLNAIKEAYQLALKEQGVQPSVQIQTVNVESFQGDKVENYNWSNPKTIQIEVFVEPGAGENPTTITDIEIEDIKEVKNSNPKKVISPISATAQTPEIINPTATVEPGKTKNASVFGWGLAALIGGALMFKKKKKKKKK